MTAWVEMTVDGPALASSTSSSMRLGFVLPPDRTGPRKPAMRVVYVEDSPGACSWVVRTAGLTGPDAPNTEPNMHNGAWRLPGTTAFEGALAVPAGPGSVHTAVFRWPFRAEPGMFVQFVLTRAGDNPADTCGTVTVVGMEVRY